MPVEGAGHGLVGTFSQVKGKQLVRKVTCEVLSNLPMFAHRSSSDFDSCFLEVVAWIFARLRSHKSVKLLAHKHNCAPLSTACKLGGSGGIEAILWPAEASVFPWSGLGPSLYRQITLCTQGGAWIGHTELWGLWRGCSQECTYWREPAADRPQLYRLHFQELRGCASRWKSVPSCKPS